MAQFESEIQELIYETLTSDTALKGYLGADGSDPRVYLPWQDSDTAKVGELRPAYIVLETMPASPPVILGSGIDDWTQRYCLHTFTRPEERELQGNIQERHRADFHRKKFITESYIIYQTSEDGKEGELTDGGLLDNQYFISFQFLSRD